MISFATIGVLWIEHHGMMSAVERVNRRFLERTLIFLLFVSLIPWPTALAADYARTGGDGARDAAVLYAAVMLLMGLSFAAGLALPLDARRARRTRPRDPRSAPARGAPSLGGFLYVPRS